MTVSTFPFSGLFITSGSKIRRHTERKGGEENATDDDKFVEFITWGIGSFGATISSSELPFTAARLCFVLISSQY